MASSLSFTATTDFPLTLTKFSNHTQGVHPFPLLPLNTSSKCFASSRRRVTSPLVAHAVKEKVIDQSPNSEATLDSETTTPSSSKLVLVVGGSGGVGQLVVASLLKQNIKSRLLLRDPEKAIALFGKQDEEKLQVFKGDTRNPEDLDPSLFEGVTHVICCTGTTAFPSKRWDGDNTPERTVVFSEDWEGVRNLVSALPSTLKRIVLVSSVGVTKFNELPWSVSSLLFWHDSWLWLGVFFGCGCGRTVLACCFCGDHMIAASVLFCSGVTLGCGLVLASIMNLFGVLKYKKMGEDFVLKSGLPFTIIRPGRLTDGPYTSYDLNTLLKATAGKRCAVVIGQGDKLVGEVSRIVVAEACIQALDIEFTEGEIYEINSVEGEGPGCDLRKWKELFKNAQSQ
ncbi:hypothetical protein SADUNF_Sadunf16G0142200 [Salix dunnii]|uniref:NAD(P)-binding domain-containing protein n=1 Tax=Salix dunnii TaxID=1413687 RepID=A0A835J9Q1_9ROSI|nr:hypothetical protein SADUNF_Sadunf16G0142200 [Salix dunnii]